MSQPANAEEELEQLLPKLPDWVTDPNGSIPVRYERLGPGEHRLYLGQEGGPIKRAIVLLDKHPGEIPLEELITLAAGAWAAIVNQCDREGADPTVINCDRDMAEFIVKCWATVTARCSN